ncbi:uncharacterized protein EDB91DRAFT_1087708 [Suillus paluster]|uniref:uncharacterized protein n=1 Tax=Suillus paluster TaxID=48578 RepID=UPI001B8678D3|nr:uncharacterized protein EDB91DRAFT_1087708 [Suillus paluster]KAG1723792.1 hypothetical protein EDB91DRAFT_1087708 [Suillus paluster]
MKAELGGIAGREPDFNGVDLEFQIQRHQEVRQTGHGRKAGGNGGGVRLPTGAVHLEEEEERRQREEKKIKAEEKWRAAANGNARRSRNRGTLRRRGEGYWSRSLGRMGVSMSSSNLKVRRNLAAPVWSIRGTVPGLRRLGPTGSELRCVPSAEGAVLQRRSAVSIDKGRSGSERRGPRLPGKGEEVSRAWQDGRRRGGDFQSPDRDRGGGQMDGVHDQAWVATANNIVVALARTNGLLEQSIAVGRGAEWPWIVGGVRRYGSLEVRDRTPEVLDKFPDVGEMVDRCCRGTKACGTKSTARELKELMSRGEDSGGEKGRRGSRAGQEGGGGKNCCGGGEGKVSEEARKVAEVRRLGVSELLQVVMCQQCEATSQACTWALVQEARRNPKGRAKAKACDQCAGLKASCKVDGDDSQPAVLAKSWKRTWEGQRSPVKGWRKMWEWVKAANNMVLVQAETNTKLGALATAITHLANSWNYNGGAEGGEEQNRTGEGLFGSGKETEVLGKRGEIGRAEVTELTTSSSGSDTEKPDEESESEAEKGLDGEETGAQLEREQSRRKRGTGGEKWKSGSAGERKVRNSIPESLVGRSNWYRREFQYRQQAEVGGKYLQLVFLEWVTPGSGEGDIEMLNMGRAGSQDESGDVQCPIIQLFLGGVPTLSIVTEDDPE